MIFFIFINEVIKLVTLFYCFYHFIEARFSICKRRKAVSLGVGIIWAVSRVFLNTNSAVYFVLDISALFILTCLCFRKRLLDHFRKVYFLFVTLELTDIILAAITFPFTKLFHMAPYTVEAELTILSGRCILCVFIFLTARRSTWKIPDRITKISSIGILLCCAVTEYAFIEITLMEFENRDIRIYKILLSGIVFGILTAILWLIDKNEEQKRIRDLTAYTHRTREVLPTVARMLAKIEVLPEYSEKTRKILTELKEICEADTEKTEREAALIMTFATTENNALDEQLLRYQEEAAEEGFHLDIIVRGPVTGILEAENMGMFELLQTVGDLYRNARHAIQENSGAGRILICFGYNEEGDYEIAVYDNGKAFPEYVLSRLGVRGTTEDGTGNGLADILENLKKSRASFVLRQKTPAHSVFTKGVCIVFDGKGEVDAGL